MAWSYFRLLYIVTFYPGYAPRGPQRRAQKRTRTPRNSTIEEKARTEASKSSDDVMGVPYPTPGGQDGPPTTDSAPSLQNFFSRDVFVCKGDGRPRWCSQCLNWKSDRTRHCREVDRCVRKMDHFCPWVGGVISETSFNCFIQFTAWTAVFCFFNLITIGVYLSETQRNNTGLNIHWIVSVALAGLFLIFSLGMTGSSVQLVLLNVTTIENLSRKSIVWDLAVYMPKPPSEAPAFPTISFGTNQAATAVDLDPQHNSIKTYAILHSKLGENPWDLGAFRNFQSVMGEHWYEWLLPIKRSPCCDHSSEESEYEFGPAVDRMRKEAGLALPEREESSDVEDEKRHRRRNRCKRRRRKRIPRGDTPNGEGVIPGASSVETEDPPDAADIV